VLSTVLGPYSDVLQGAMMVFLVCGSVVAHDDTKVILMIREDAHGVHNLLVTQFSRAHTQIQPWGILVPGQWTSVSFSSLWLCCCS
jgi:uncharacterized membrane protein